MVHLGPLQPEEWTAALHLAYARVPAEEREAQVLHGLCLIADGVLDPSLIYAARSASNVLLGVQVCVPLAGASCLFWLPTVSGPLAGHLLTACLTEARRRGLKVAHAIVSSTDLPHAQPFLQQGFHHVTRMHYLQHALTGLAPAAPCPLRFESFRAAPRWEFARTLQHTYEGTLDCPELNGQRTIEEILVGHQGEGKFNPDHWWLAYHGTQPAGLLLLAELLDGLSWDLAYLGIVPEYRRHGFGRALVSHALQFVSQRPATQLLASVDARNLPARQLYASVGFTELQTYEIFLRFLQGFRAG